MSFQGWQQVSIQTKNGEVTGIAPLIISASRATDIPAFYPEWFLHRLKKGYVKWINRFNQQPMYVSLRRTRAVVFWTKNAQPIIDYLPELDRRNIHYYFTFTLNDYEDEHLEPNVPDLTQRISSFKRLSHLIGRERVIWRFDPLLLTNAISPEKLLDRIYRIGKQMYRYTEKLVVSFIDIKTYKKVHRNLRVAGFKDCREFCSDDMVRIAQGLQEFKREWNIEISTCAEVIDLSKFDINHNKCIDDDLLRRLFSNDLILMDFLGWVPDHDGFLTFKKGERVRLRKLKDTGQRKACGCIPAKDIGQYSTCMHRCIYCYANSSPKRAEHNYHRHKNSGGFCEAIVCD